MKAVIGSGLRARPAKRASPSLPDAVCHVFTPQVAEAGAFTSVIV